MKLFSFGILGGNITLIYFLSITDLILQLINLIISVCILVDKV